MDKTRQGTTTKVALALIGIAMATGACAQDGDAQGDNETTEVASALGPNAPWVTWHQVTGILKDIDMSNASARWGINTGAYMEGFQVVRWVGDRWFTRPMGGVQIAVLDSIPIVVTNTGKIWKANNTNGTSWTQMSALPDNDVATAIGAGNGAIWVVGQLKPELGGNGRVYMRNGFGGGWAEATRSGTRVAVSCDPIPPKNVSLLDSLGNVFRGFDTNRPDPSWGILDNLGSGLTDVALAHGTDPSVFSVFGYQSGPFVTRSGGSSSLLVTTFNGDFFNAVGSYPVAGGFPKAVSADCSNNRIWIVNNDGRLYYGD